MQPKNSIIKQFEILFSLNNIKLEFTDKAIDAIAKIAYDKELGARGLRSIIEKLLIDHQYVINRYITDGVVKIIIDEDTVLHNTEAKIEYDKERS